MLSLALKPNYFVWESGVYRLVAYIGYAIRRLLVNAGYLLVGERSLYTKTSRTRYTLVGEKSLYTKISCI